MGVIRSVLAESTTSISELKKNPMAVIEESGGFPVAVLNRNQPAFYCMSAETYEAMLDKLDDVDLAELVRAREGQEEIEMRLDDL